MTPSHWRIAAGAWVFAVCLVLNAGAAAAFADPGTHSKGGDGSTPPTNHVTTTGDSHPRQPGSVTTARVMPSTTRTDAGEQGRVRLGPKAADSDDATTGVITPHRKLAAAAASDPSATSDTNATDDSAPSADPSPAADSTAIATPTPQPTPDPDPPTTEAAAATPETSTPPTTPNDPPPSDTASPATTAASPPPTLAEPTTDQGGSNPVETAPPADTGETSQEVIPPVVTDVAPTPPPTVVVAPPVVTAVAEPLPAIPARSRAGVNALSPLQIFRLMTDGSWFSSAGIAAVASAPRGSGIPSLLTSTSSGFGTKIDLATTSTSTATTPAPSGAAAALPEGLRMFFHSYGQLVIAASLSAAAAAALPGLAGMALPALAGMRIGYRQAKAARNLRPSGIARFAGSGPLGIVRSGSVVSFRSRVPRRDATNTSDRVA